MGGAYCEEAELRDAWWREGYGVGKAKGDGERKNTVYCV